LDGFAAAVNTFAKDGGRGANVTVPFKLEAYALANLLTERAQAAGAVNTLKFDDSTILGDNTDGVGLVADIVRNAGTAVFGKKILLLGAGGAARGVVLPLLSERPSELVIANRTQSRAVELAHSFSSQYGNIHASDYAELNEPFDIVINATSASLESAVPPIPPAVFGAGTLAYDMMYAKEPTVFMRFAARYHAHSRDGLGMLIEQAAESFFVWRGVRPDTVPVFTELRAQLSLR
jgi:shikimate dehydrogenase